MSHPVLGSCRCCGGRVSTEAIACPHCGQPNPASGQEPWALQARSLMNAGNKIEAIKLVREKTGMDLKEAKDLVESW